MDLYTYDTALISECNIGLYCKALKTRANYKRPIHLRKEAYTLNERGLYPVLRQTSAYAHVCVVVHSYLYMTPHSYASIIYASIVKLSKHAPTRRALFTVKTEPHTLWENPSQCNPHRKSIQDTAFIGACHIVLSSEECTPIPSTFIGACHIVLSSEECTPIPSTFIGACRIVLSSEECTPIPSTFIGA